MERPTGSTATAAAYRPNAVGEARPSGASSAAILHPPETSANLAADDKISKCSKADVKHIRHQFHLPATITTRAMSAEERSTRPPPSQVAFNKAIMKHGARLPLHPLVRGVLAHWGLAPSQLNPNAYKIMAGMHIFWRVWFTEDVTMEEVCHLYKPSSKKSEAGYFFLAPWEKKKILMTNLSSSCEGWKDRNFWVGGDFDPCGSEEGAPTLPRAYQVPGEFGFSRSCSSSLFSYAAVVLMPVVVNRFFRSCFRVRGAGRTDYQCSVLS